MCRGSQGGCEHRLLWGPGRTTCAAFSQILGCLTLECLARQGAVCVCAALAQPEAWGCCKPFC